MNKNREIIGKYKLICGSWLMFDSYKKIVRNENTKTQSRQKKMLKNYLVSFSDLVF
jgi:hypothetical protein